MARIIQCPGCHKTLKLPDSAVGKQAQCPVCAEQFVVPALEPEPQEQHAELPDAEEEEPPRGRFQDEDEDRPRRRRRSRPRRDRGDRETIAPSPAPLILAILGCLCSCAPLIGFGLGYFAVQQADLEMDRLPGSKRYAASRAFVTVAKVLGIVAMCLSVVLMVVAVALNIFFPLRR